MNRDIPVHPNETPVHKALRKLAGIMDWAVTSTYRPSWESLHRTRAVDLAARAGPGWDTPDLLEINLEILDVIPQQMISELIYSGPGNICIKDGRRVNGRQVYAKVWKGHHDHVHLAVVPHFKYNPPEEPMPDPIRAQAPVVNLVPTPTGKGYWIITAAGEIFAFGDAQFYGRVEAPKS